MLKAQHAKNRVAVADLESETKIMIALQHRGIVRVQVRLTLTLTLTLDPQPHPNPNPIPRPSPSPLTAHLSPFTLTLILTLTLTLTLTRCDLKSDAVRQLVHEEGGGHLVSATDGGAAADGAAGTAGAAGAAGAARREQCSLRTGWYSQHTSPSPS